MQGRLLMENDTSKIVSFSYVLFLDTSIYCKNRPLYTIQRSVFVKSYQIKFHVHLWGPICK